jgi:multicomponent Na+:H+ antiporter subunit D
MIVVAPLLISAFTAIACVLIGKVQLWERWLSQLGALALFFVGGLLVIETFDGRNILVLQAGGWIAPFGVSLVVDALSAVMVLITGLLGSAVIFYSHAKPTPGFFHPLFHGLLLGVSGTFLTGDIFNMYVWFEVMLISSFGLLILGGERAALNSAVKYVTLNLLGSMIFLSAAGLLYGAVGTLNIADLAWVLTQNEFSSMTPGVAAFFLIAFGLKAGVFPMYFWLPASYPTPSVSVIAVFAGLLTKVGVYALIRVLSLPWGAAGAWLEPVILSIALLTMVSGVLGATIQNRLRHILSWHIISQVGYMVLGLALLAVGGTAAAIFFMIHHIVVKTNLFLVTGLIERLQGTDKINVLGGLRAKSIWVSIAFAVPAMSLAGVPPFSGFWAKLWIFKVALQNNAFGSVFVAVCVSLLTMYSMVKIWSEVFLKEAPAEANNDSPFAAATTINPWPRPKEWLFLSLPIFLLLLWTVGLGLYADPAMALAQQAADQLRNPQAYIQRVLKTGGEK